MLASALTLASEDMGKIGMLGGLTLGAMFIVFLALAVFMEERRKTVQTREREETKREIAAYVAEGSMTPDDAERILSSGPFKDFKDLKDRFKNAMC